jgi:hypothetical protein
MNIFIKLALISSCLVISACSNTNIDADGVPKIRDLKHIEVDGQPMSAAEFIKEYCTNNVSFNETCRAVFTEDSLDRLHR